MKWLNFTYLALIIPFTKFSNAEFIYSCTENKTIALTFDDGPFKYTKELVDYFVDKHSDVKVTFFHVGKFHYPFAIETQEFQDAMKKAHDNGLQIASHTFEHKISSKEKEFNESLTTMDDFIEKVTGDRPRYFRAPKGNCGKDCQKLLDDWDYRLIQWDTDTNDWDLESSGSIQKRIEDSINFLTNEFAKEKDNYLILMHDSENYTVSDIAPWIIEKSGMKEKGYRFVTVAECLGERDKMYRSGKVYGYDNNNNNNNNSNDKKTDIVADESDKHNLDSGVLPTFKLISFMTYAYIMSLFFYIMI